MNSVATLDPAPGFLAEIERVRASGTLGRGTQLQRLFEFLVACQAVGRVPKELEVAVDCFERGPSVDVAQDATVRVTAHKLRKRLDEFYRGNGAAARLTIPRGEYRLALEAVAAPEVQVVPDAPVAGWRRLLPATARERVAALLLCGVTLLGAAALAVALRAPQVPAAVVELRQSALWAPLLADELPVQLVLGDYFIFGERDERGDVRRLVRDFGINSRQDLERGFVTDPALAERYADLNLGYLPTSSAQALREVLPVVMASGKQVTLTLASELDPSTIKSTHIVYIGYLSALGMLQDMVLTASRYSFGASYDELVDSGSDHVWVSEAGQPHGMSERYRDYAYLAGLRGPGGHAHLIIAGTRDTGLMQAAEAAADIGALRAAEAKAGGAKAFEALYEVQSANGLNVDSRLIEASAIKP